MCQREPSPLTGDVPKRTVPIDSLPKRTVPIDSLPKRTVPVVTKRGATGICLWPITLLVQFMIPVR